MKNILSMEATTLAQKIRMGELTSLEVTETYINHIKQVNPYIRSIVETRFDEAKQEAREKDQLLRNGKAKGKLFGVPISVKESFFVEGMVTTSGIPARKKCKDPWDADVIQALKNEGAIILGKTNTPTLLLCTETDNTVFGRTNNPWDLERHSGGSSGGEGALIAVGGAAVGIGSDIGGSIRYPAHFNGVIGFKSGKQQVSDVGHFPPFSSPYKRDMQGIGPIAKSVNDAKCIYEIIAKHPLKKLDMRQFELVTLHPNFRSPLSTYIHKKMIQIEQELSKHMTIRHELPPHFDEAALLWLAVMTYGNWKEELEVAGVHKEEDLYQRDLHPYFIELMKLELPLCPTPEDVQQVFKSRLKAEQKVKDYFKNKVLVLPIFHTTAQKHGQMIQEVFSKPENIIKYTSCTVYVNAFGLPALVIPVGEDENGLPFGVQLTTSVGQEYALFEIGKQVESLFRGYKRCSKWDAE